MNKVAVINLGCPKNQIDAETMLGLMIEEGYQITHKPEQAEIIIVNTCGFIDKARKESIDQILNVAQYKDTGNCQQLIVTGCLSQRYHEELANELPEVDAFLGTGSVDKILDVLKSNQSLIGKPDIYDGLAESRRYYSTYPYAYLKIAEGCNNHCSYCVIPKLRGKLRSKKREQIISEANQMVKSGIKEVILIAQDTSQYGVDKSGTCQLPSLLSELDQIPGMGWIRLLYCYPDHINDELIEVLSKAKNVVKYLDIPLQHSHPEVLASMGRNRSGMPVRQLIETLRDRIPGISLRTTFIVGYPGETDEHFQHLLDFVTWAKFDQLGAFVYSKEAGTRAAEITNQVPGRIKARRYHEIMKAQQKVVLERNRSLVGQHFTVLIDGIKEGTAIGRSYRDAPEVDSNFLVPANGFKAGDFVNVKCTAFDGYDLVGVEE